MPPGAKQSTPPSHAQCTFPAVARALINPSLDKAQRTTRAPPAEDLALEVLVAVVVLVVDRVERRLGVPPALLATARRRGAHAGLAAAAARRARAAEEEAGDGDEEGDDRERDGERGGGGAGGAEVARRAAGGEEEEGTPASMSRLASPWKSALAGRVTCCASEAASSSGAPPSPGSTSRTA